MKRNAVSKLLRVLSYYFLCLCLLSLSSQSIFAVEMEYVEVVNEKGKAIKFSRLIMGTDHLAQVDWNGRDSKKISEKDIFKLLDEAARLGINLFDTAPIYVGDIEYKLGKWIKSWKRKNPGKEVYVLSKGGFPFDLYWAKKLPLGENSNCLQEMLQAVHTMAQGYRELPNVPIGTYASRLFGSKKQINERIKEEIGHTLKNLNGNPTVYLMHRDDGDFINYEGIKRSKTPVRRIMEALSEKELRNKFTFLGWSNWKPYRITRSIKLAQKHKHLAKPCFNSPYFSLFAMSERSIHAGGVQVTHEDMMNPNFLKGIKMMPYSPLAGVSIFDKPVPRWENAKKDARKKYWQGDPYWKNVYHAVFTCANNDRYARVVNFTRKFNKKHKTSYTVDQMVNAYALAHVRMDFLTIGPITVDQLRRTVAALELARMLTADDLDYLYYGDE